MSNRDPKVVSVSHDTAANLIATGAAARGAQQMIEVHRCLAGSDEITLKVIARAYAHAPRGGDVERELRELLVAKSLEEGPAL